VIALGLCAVAFVVSSGDAIPQEDSISNVYAGYVSGLRGVLFCKTGEGGIEGE